MQLGVYNASRVRGEFSEAMPAPGCFLPQLGDYQALHERDLLLFEQAISMSQRLLEEVLDEETTSVPMKLDGVVAPGGTEVAHGGTEALTALLESDALGLDEDDQYEYDKHLTMYKSMYGEDIHTDTVLKMDLNANSTVKALMRYGLRILSETRLRRDVESGGGGDDDAWSSFDAPAAGPIMDHLGACLICDGAPNSTISRMKEQTGEWNEIRNVYAGFHSVLEFRKMIGKCFEESHLGTFVNAWRPSEGKAKFILSPGDPTQCLAEFAEYQFAHFTNCARLAAEAHDPDDGPFTAQSAFEYRLSRARQCPLAMIVLLELEFTQACYMMCDAERVMPQGNFPLFERAQHIMTLLLSVTNATGYMRLHTDERRRWSVASEAERLVHELFLFTKQSKNGYPIFSDRFFEWHQKDLRKFVFKADRPGLEAELNRTVRQLPEMIANSTFSFNRHGDRDGVVEIATMDARPVRDVKVTKVFRGTMKILQSSRLWEVDAELRSSTGAPLSSEGFRNLENKRLDENLVALPALMLQRAEAYSRASNSEYSAEGGAGGGAVAQASDLRITQVPVLAENVALSAARMNMKLSCVDVAVLKNDRLMTVAESMAELKVHAQNEYYDMPRPSPQSQGRDVVLACLCDARRKAAIAGNDPDPVEPAAQSSTPPVVPPLPSLLTALPASFARPLREFDPALVSSRERADGGDEGGGDGTQESLEFGSPPFLGEDDSEIEDLSD